MPKLPRGQPAHVTPEVLLWARERARLDLPVVAEHLKLAPAVVDSWERGIAKPTVPQMRKLASFYKRPVAVFYLESPPLDFSVMEEYRIHRLSEREGASKALSLEITAAQERRISILDIAEDMQEEFPRFQLQASLETPIHELARAIRTAMGIELDEQIQWHSTETALKHWIRAVENLNVLIFQSSKFDLREARGFSMFFEILPIILISGKDAPAGKIFTLMHELVHLILVNHNPQMFQKMESGGNKYKKQNKDVEFYCNAVASEIMLPESALLQHPIVSRIQRSSLDMRDLSELARHFSVSRDAVLLRLLKAMVVREEVYRAFQNALDGEYTDLLQRRAAQAKNKKGGPPPYAMALRDLGATYTRVVLEALNESVISTSTASGLLSLKVRHFDTLSSALMGRLSQEAS